MGFPPPRNAGRIKEGIERFERLELLERERSDDGERERSD